MNIPGMGAAPEEESKEPVQEFENRVKILGIEMFKNRETSDKVPKPERFEDFSLDDYSLKLLQDIAKAVEMDSPLMIEGEQAIGKTITVEYLAMLLNKPVYRMSLNGQTDVTDLIGKWVPRVEGLKDKINVLLKHPEKCTSEEARKLIEAKTKIENIDVSKLKESDPSDSKVIAKQKIGLTKKEMQQIAELEGIEVSESEWAWQNGDIPKQMLEGAWSVLDEVNTCEPQILVRLNAVLEKGGQLVLHEDGSKVIPRHKDFRLFATVNPPGGDFKGRVPLSAEWISRWNYQNLGKLPKNVFKSRVALSFGCTPQEPELKNLRYLSLSPILEDKKMTAYYQEEWLADLADKFSEFVYKGIEMLEKKSICQKQEQKFVFDQRDAVRFEDYLRKFHEVGRMKEVITEAIEHLFMNKCKDKKDRDDLKLVAEELIKVQEPEIKAEAQELLEMEKQLRAIKGDLLGMGLPPEAKSKIMGKGEPKKK